MLRHYIKVALRNLRKQPLYSLINIFGLSIGIACCILIYLFVQHEWSFDNFHEKAGKIYRVVNVNYNSTEASQKEALFFDTRAPEGVDKSENLPLPLGPALKNRYPEIQRYFRYNESRALFRKNNETHIESVSYVESNFFDLFSFGLLTGNPSVALTDRYNIVITPAIATKYFGNNSPVGKTLQIISGGQEQSFTVSGVIEPPPSNTSIRYQVLIPIENSYGFEQNIDNWDSFNTSLFIELDPETDSDQMEAKLNDFYAERYGDAMNQFRQNNNMPEQATVMEFELTPLTHIHLDASVEWPGVSNPLYSYILSGIAVLILVIACINYITLALTRSSNRMVEISMRKVVGANRRQIARQFWGETLLMTLLAMVIGLVLAELFLPIFNELSGKSLAISYSGDAGFLGAVLGLTVITGLISGSYPAFFLAGFQPVEIFKGLDYRKFKPRMTKGLLILQFSLSVFLIISSVIMYRQMEFVSQKNLGYNEDQIVVIPTYTGWNEAGTRLMERYRNEVEDITGVTEISGMAPAFTRGSNRSTFQVRGENKEAFVFYVDDRFLETMGMKLVSGRKFSADRPTDATSAVIVNQALVESMSWEEPVGQLLPWRGEENPSSVIGVVENFHFQSLEAPIEPIILHMNSEVGGVGSILVKMESGKIAETLSRLEEEWARVAPSRPFNYWFLDDAVAQQYETYTRLMQIMGWATVLAILIACLGLFGLAGIMSVNKTKEIGIRKVLGAGMREIILLLNRDIIKLVIISLLIAAPLSWYVMRQWLSDFAYHIDINLGMFLWAGLASLAIAVITVSYYSAKAALVNPVESLRSE